jgi:hypothetical protein
MEIKNITLKDLIGTWKLNSFIQTEQANGNKTYPMGKNPNGTITFTPDSRVVVFICSNDRPNPTDLNNVSENDQLSLYNSMMAYAGVVTFTGINKGNFTIDIAWNQSWIGNVQSKLFSINDNQLDIVVGPMLGIAGYEIMADLNWTKITV